MLTSSGPPAPGDDTDPACPGCADEPGDDTWDTPVLPGQQAALEALQWHWGTAYHIGVDDGQWWYKRRDGKGGTETAGTPDDLRRQIVLDYTTYPVPRELHIST